MKRMKVKKDYLCTYNKVGLVTPFISGLYTFYEIN